MASYRKILAAVDLNEETNVVLYKAVEVAEKYNAELTVLHVIEPVGYAYGGDIPIDLSEVQEQLRGHATSELKKACLKFDIPEKHQSVLTGRPEHEIHQTARDGGYDLIIVGSHGKHGIQLLFGSTASGVLHGTPCDVLAVRLGHP